MLDPKGFFDYCIEEQCLESNYDATIKLLYDYGYRTVAINQTIDTSDLEQKKKKKKGEPREAQNDIVPEPFKIKKVLDMCILNRLTIVFSNPEALIKIVKSPNYKKYHIIGVLPTTTTAVLHVCSNFDADIFTFNPVNKNNIKRSRKIYKQLIDKGYHFEIPYSAAIQDTTKRKNIIHTAHLYHTFIKSKNIIISSSATNVAFIRSPYDVINLALIFGLNELQAKSAISHCGRQVFVNSVGRRHGKAVVFAETVEKSNDKSVISLSESEEDMEVDEPAMKKIKQ